MNGVAQGIGEIIGAFLAGIIMAIIYAGCIGWGLWRVFKLLGRPEKQVMEFVLPILFILLGVIGFICSP